MSYRKLDPELWDDERFIALSDTAKLVWLALITGPQTGALPGLQIADHLVLASTLRKEPEPVRAALAEIEAAGMCEVDSRLRLIRMPKAPRRNLPANENVLRSWWNAWRSMPSSPLKTRHLESVKEAISLCKPWAFTAWKETFGTVTKTVSPIVSQPLDPSVSVSKTETKTETGPSANSPVWIDELEAHVRTEYPNSAKLARGLVALRESVTTPDDAKAFTKALENYQRKLVVEDTPARYVMHLATFVADWRAYLDYEPQPPREVNAPSGIRAPRQTMAAVMAKESE